jgi:RNA polymerase sigma factor (sigma-70 family)
VQFLGTSQYQQFSDKELILQYKQSADNAILGALYQRYMDMLYGVCVKYLKDSELAKDAVLNVYEDLARKLQKHEVDNFRSWIHTVAKNYCLMYLRSPKNKQSVAFDGTFMQSEQEVHLTDVMEKESNFDKLAKCIETLELAQQTTVTLFYYKQKCYKEIAETTGFEVSAVRSYIQNGRRNLKNCMEK